MYNGCYDIMSLASIEEVSKKLTLKNLKVKEKIAKNEFLKSSEFFRAMKFEKSEIESIKQTIKLFMEDYEKDVHWLYYGSVILGYGYELYRSDDNKVYGYKIDNNGNIDEMFLCDSNFYDHILCYQDRDETLFTRNLVPFAKS